MKVLIGNDIVDLTHPDIRNKHLDERFINRILAAKEKLMLKASSNPKLLLWTLWSGKEAAYKVLKKLIPDMIFSHSKIIVEVGNKKDQGIVHFGDYLLSIIWANTREWIHSLAILKKDEEKFKVLEYDIKNLDEVNTNMNEFSKAERESIYSSQSAGVRKLCKVNLKKYNINETEIIRRPLSKKFGPPELKINNQSLKNWDLSLSHDGRFIACAFSKGISL